MTVLRARPRVLVAEDHTEVAKAVCRVLALDCELVGMVASGGAVMEATQRLRPDVIVLDLNLPDISGLQVCQQVMESHPTIRVVVFTAMNDPDVRNRALEVGAAAFVSKTAGAGDLLSTVTRLWATRFGAGTS
jgi:DNA-binding NarL/FixJ family response regulator